MRLLAHNKSEIMFDLLLGHLAGDYLLQNDWMARNKTRNDWTGWLSATVHCVIYTLAVCLFMWNFDLIWIGAVFLSHFPIDKFGFGTWYMKRIKNYDMRAFIDKQTHHNEAERMTMIRASFLAVVYTVTDNAMHLILMWGAYQIIY